MISDLALTRDLTSEPWLITRNDDSYALSVSAALIAENLSYTTWCLMLAIRKHGEPTLATLALETGLSYWAVRNQLQRNHWFEKHHGDRTTATMIPEGLDKLARIDRRLKKAA